jgi:hypothetical protein
VSLELALYDAATNCIRDGAVATVIFKSGTQLIGELQKSSGADLGTRHMKFKDGGWATFLIDEVASVEVHPRPRERVGW